MKKTLMKLRIMSMVLSLLFLCSCNRSVIEILDPVIKPESYTLHLPKESSIAFSGYAVDLEKLIYLRTLTLPQRKVEVFDLTTGNIMSDFNVKGNGNLGGIFYKRNAGYYVFDNAARKLFFVDLEGNIVESWEELSENAIPELSNFYSGWEFNQVVGFGDSLVFVTDFAKGFDFDHKHPEFINLPNLRIFNTTSNNFSWTGKISPSNTKFDNGMWHRYTFTIAHDQIIVSAGYSSEMAIVDLPSGATKFIEDSKVEDFLSFNRFRTWDEKEEKPYNAAMDETMAMMDHFRRSPSFSSIFFDPNKELIYRLFIKPKTEDKSGEAGVLVYDNNLNFKSIYRIPSAYILSGAFVSEGGLNLINYDAYKKDNARLIFDTFAFE